MPAPILGVAIEYGIPAGVEIVKLGLKWIEKMRNNPNMTQEEYNAEWAEMQEELRPITDAHEALRQQGR